MVPCPGARKGPAWKLALMAPVFTVVLACITVGVLSPELAAERHVPLYDLAQSVSVFGVVEHIEPLLSAAMIMGVFAAMSALVCGAQAAADGWKTWKWSGTAVCFGAGLLMAWTVNWPMVWIAAGSVILWLAVPVLVLIFRKENAA